MSGPGRGLGRPVAALQVGAMGALLTIRKVIVKKGKQLVQNTSEHSRMS